MSTSRGLLPLVCAFALLGCKNHASTPDGGGGTDAGAADLAPACSPPVLDGGAACDGSASCAVGQACTQAACVPIAGCGTDCSCSNGRICDGMKCVAPPAMACAPCSTTGTDACTQAGGACKSWGCAPKCDDTTTFCPPGFTCSIANGHTTGYCNLIFAKTCDGCAADSDCPSGQVCNPNNRRCVPTPTGVDARLEMETVDFLGPDAMGNMVKARNLSWSLGFFARRDPSLDVYGVAAGDCVSERSTFDDNAPYPLGPLRDAGPLTLKLGLKSFVFTATANPNPVFGFQYDSTSSPAIADFVAGAASWMGAGAGGISPFTANLVVPADFTTTPDLLTTTAPTATVASGITVTLSPAAESGVRTLLELAWSEGSGSTITASTTIVCRAQDNATSVTIPGNLLTSAPRSTELSLVAMRASVVDFSPTGVQQGRASLAVQKSGSVIIAP
jgi:Cys-rich repeat protein